MKKAYKYIVTVLVVALLTTNAYANEIYYYQGVGVNLRRSTLSGSAALIKTNGSYLSGNWSSKYTTATNAWPNKTSQVVVNRTTMAQSNVDLTTTSMSFWDERYPADYLYAEHFGYTENTTTDGVVLKAGSTAAQAYNSSKRISYSGIYLSPYVSDDGMVKYTMVHELGHSLGLGHYSGNSASVMKSTGVYPGYYLPRNKDVTDIENKY